MKTKTFAPGDKIKLKTKSRTWEGYALQSHDPEIILLKLSSGYNIGIRENEILDATILEKATTHYSLPAKRTTSETDYQRSGLQKLPNVVFVITGGTISSRLDSKTGGVISTDKEAILDIAPEIKNICNPIIVSPFMKFSEDMGLKDWGKLAETCEPYLNDESIRGIIITHGTDTLHYTAAALSFFIQNLNKPIALTYSQRSVDRASTDAALNLICSAKYAISDIAEIALVGHKNTNDEICLAMPATKVRKLHTSKRDAFKIVNGTPIAEITLDKINILKTFNARSDNKGSAPINNKNKSVRVQCAPTNNKNKSVRVPKIDTKFLDKVALIKIYPGQDPSILEYYKQEGYKGIVLEVTGLGQVPGKASSTNWIPKIKKAIQDGMVICATPQTIYGRLNPNVYSTGRELQKTGIIFLGGMLSETALVKLGWILGHKKWNIKEKMLEEISNE